MTVPDTSLSEPIDPAVEAPPIPSGPPGEATRLSERLAPMFAQAFAAFGQGERVIWEIGIQALPGPPEEGAPLGPNGQQMPTWETMLIIYAEILGIVPSTRIFRGFPVMPHAWDQDKANAAAQQIVRVLLEGRRQQLEAMQREAEQSMTNGTPAPAHGLILPG